jgi:hypothetical protein
MAKIPKATETKDNKTENPAPTGKPHYKERLSAINEIAAQNKAAREDALNENDPNEPAVEDDVKAANEAAQKEIEHEPEQTIDKPEPAKRKFIVDGKEVELSDEEITQHVQKSATADTRLREAARLFEDAKKAAPTHQDVSRQLPTRETANGPLPEPSDAGHADVVGELTAALSSGDQEAVAKALNKAWSNQHSGMTREQVQAITLETNAFLNAKKLLDEPPEKGGFSDIYSDPMLKAHFERRENELRDAGDKRPYQELYTVIGTEVRKWRDEFVAKYIPKSGLEDRDAAKRATGVVRGAGAKLTPPPAAQPQTHEQKLESMRRARGLN